jgi:hypothetical protein
MLEEGLMVVGAHETVPLERLSMLKGASRQVVSYCFE